MNKLAHRLPSAWKTSLVAGVSARLVITFWGILSFLLGISEETMRQREIYYYGIKPIVDGVNGALWGIWQRWDSIYYIIIAEKGYSNNEFSVFFPLYPLLGRWISAITSLEILPALSLISFLSMLVCLALLYQIVARLNPSWAVPSVLMMTFFPSSFFFWAAYPQSLAMAFMLLAIWAGLRQSWLLAGLAGMAAGLTHSTTLPLVIALGVLALSQNWMVIRKYLPLRISAKLALLFQPKYDVDGKRNGLAFFAALTPILGSVLFLVWRTWMSFPDFTTLLLERWGRASQFPWVTLLRLPLIFQSANFNAVGWANLATFILACVVAVWSIKHLPTWVWSYQIIGLLMLLSQDLAQEPLWGFNRYGLFLFPMYIALSAWTDGHKRLRFYILTGMAILQLYFCLLHMQWVWVG